MAGDEEIRELFRRLSHVEAQITTHEAVCTERYDKIDGKLNTIMQTLSLAGDRRDKKIDQHSSELNVLNNERQQRLGAKSLLVLVAASAGGGSALIQGLIQWLGG